MKLLYLDLETTGTKFWKNGIHQISGCVEIDGEVKQEFNFNVRPYPSAQIEEKALEVSNVTMAQIMEYPDMGNIYTQIIAMLSKYVDKYNKADKFFIVGYNCASFDNQFFRAWFVQNGDEYYGSWFWSVPLDVIVLATEYLKHQRHNMPNFQLKTVAQHLGIDVDESKLHDASFDIELTRKIYHLVTKKECVV